MIQLVTLGIADAAPVDVAPADAAPAVVSAATPLVVAAVAAAAVLVAALALVLALVALRRLGRLRRELDSDARLPSSDPSSESVSLPPSASPSSLAAGPHGDVAFDPQAIRDLAIVRYDALQEMGGRLSFSLALLNAAGDGVIVTSINGRTETRTYAKVIRGGEPTHPLSPEEERAVREARRGSQPPNGSSAGHSAPGGRSEQAAAPASSRGES